MWRIKSTYAQFKKRKTRACTIDYPDYIFIYNGKERHTSATEEVGLLTKNTYTQETLMLQYNLKNEYITISVYAWNISKPKENSEAFYGALVDQENKTPKQNRILLLRDLNARDGNILPIPSIMNGYNQDHINSNRFS